MRKAKGYGSVIKMSGNRRKPFAVRITSSYSNVGGKIEQKFKYIGYYKTYEDAEICLAEYNKEPYNIDFAKISFKDLYDHYLKMNEEYISSSMMKQIKCAYKHCEVLYRKPVKSISFDQYQDVINKCKLSYSTKSKIKCLISSLCKYAHRNRIISQNYSCYLKIGKKSEPRSEVMSKEDIKFITDMSNDDLYYDISLILLYTGLRITELLEMKKENVFLNERYMIGGIKTKAGKNRMIPIHSFILGKIEKYMNTPGKYLINNSGTRIPYTSFRYNWMQKPILKKYRIHTTRHTFISSLHSAGVPEVSIKFIVGHSQVGITDQVYVHKNLEELIREVNKLSYI